MSRIISGRIKKAGKKPADLEVALSEIQGGIAKKAAVKK